MSPACHRGVLTPSPGPHSLIPTGPLSQCPGLLWGNRSRHKRCQFMTRIPKFSQVIPVPLAFTLCVWLPWIHILNVNEHLNTRNDELHFSHPGLCFPFQKHFQAWAPKRSVGPDPSACIKLTGHPSSKTLSFLSLLTFLKLHPLTHISSETVLSTGSHCLLLKEAFWPSHDKIENQTNPTVNALKVIGECVWIL